MEDLLKDAIDKIEALKSALLTNVEISVNDYGDGDINLNVDINYKKGTLTRTKEGEIFIPEKE